jgi:hypothetical protein
MTFSHSGTDFWGLLNPDWNLCNRGKRQSPINIDPATLLFDPDLGPIRVDESRVTGILENNGHSIIFRILTPEELLLQASVSSSTLSHPLSSLLLIDQEGHDHPSSSSSPTTFNLHSPHHHRHGPSHLSNSSSSFTSSLVSVPENEVSPISNIQSSSLPMSLKMTSPENPSVTITGGPLSYNYQFDSIYLHFGRTDLHGSEHVVAGTSFPAEVSVSRAALFTVVFLVVVFVFVQPESRRLNNIPILIKLKNKNLRQEIL